MEALDAVKKAPVFCLATREQKRAITRVEQCPLQ